MIGEGISPKVSKEKPSRQKEKEIAPLMIT